MATVNPLALTDADFAALGSPEELPEAPPAKTQEELDAEKKANDEAEAARLAEEEAAKAATQNQEEQGKQPGQEDGLTEAERAAQAEGETEGEETPEQKAEKERLAAEAGKTPGKDGTPAGGQGDQTQTEKEKGGTEAGKTQTQEIDYKAAYEALMKPFKANGRMIELKSPEELIQLAQMGANYTRKLQELQPSKKLLMMLENHDLLDEGKLSFLIDLSKKDPEAIKKLVKDSGLNPQEMDIEAESNYQPGNHRVADEEVLFKTALDDVRSQPKGQESLVLMNQTWDQASKEVLWKQPALMKVMHQQIESGVYGLINAEIDRKRTLGQIPMETPFLDAYKLVGDEMAKAGAFNELAGSGNNPGQKAPVAKTVATPNPVVKNEAQARAAAATRTSAKTPAKVVNPLAMSDEEFLKQMENRV